MSAVFVSCEKRLARYIVIPLRLSPASRTLLFSSSLSLMILRSFHRVLLAIFLSVSQSGITNYFALTTYLSGFCAGLSIDKPGRYVELFWVGQGLLVAGLGLFTHLDASACIAQLCGVQVLAATGLGMLFALPLISLQASCSQSQTAKATATITLVRSITTVLAVVGGQVIFQNGMRARQGQIAAIGLPCIFSNAFTGDETAVNIALVGGISHPVQRLLIQGVFAQSLRNVWGLGCLSLRRRVYSKLIYEKEEAE